MTSSDQMGTVYVDLEGLVSLQHDAHGFSLASRQSLRSALAGRHASKLRGRGIDFDELRHYRPGDDVRMIDWRATNRTGRPHVRAYTAERERPVVLVVDQRMSMFFGSRWKMKSVVAAELAALVAWRIVRARDRIGAFIFDETQTQEIKPQRSRQATLALLSEIARFNQKLKIDTNPRAPEETGTHLLSWAPSLWRHQNVPKTLSRRQNRSTRSEPQERAFANVLAKVERVIGHDSLVVLISDLTGWDRQCSESMARIKRHNDVVVMHVCDPLERALPSAAPITVSDGHLQVRANLQDAQLRQDYETIAAARFDRTTSDLANQGIVSLVFNTIDPPQDQLRRWVGQARSI